MKDSIERIIRDLEADAATLETTDVEKWEDTPTDIARINRAYADRLRALVGIAVVDGKQKLGGER